jgi:two-component system response regulator PilR (NtrC family)
VNCGGIPETLLESELFGHVKGAFTGAIASKKGLFDMASGGTIFLDEIGEMTPAMQVKLLRTLQERRVRPVGASEDHPVDIRIIAATNRNLEAMVAEKGFREDLYYRINVISIRVPPLRERREDIALLATHFLRRNAPVMGKGEPALSREALEALEGYAWPGNIRELENVVERAMAIAPGPRIERGHLPEGLQGLRAPRTFHDIEVPPAGFDLNEAVEGIRKVYILKAIELEGGNVTRAARRLGITFRSIRHFVKKYGIQAKDESE